MNTPKIRFKGFTDDWEQRKVGEFLTESRESGHKGDIAHKMTVKLWGKGVYEKKETGSANTQYFTRHAGQFIYSKLDFLNCAFGVVPEELENLETTADVPAFDCDGVNPYFMFYTAIQPRFYEKNGMIADGSRKAKRIHADTFLDMPFFVPSLKEQNKIVNLLSELDHLITLHQRKCDETKELKKYMLQKMFPKNGEKNPEIRFEGFTDDWEQRKLIDYLDVSNEKNKKGDYKKTDVLSVSGEVGIVNQIEFQGRSFAGVSVENYGIVNEGDVVYTKSPLKANPYGIIKTNKGKAGIVSTLYAVYKPKENTDSDFVQIYFELDSRMNSYMHPLVNKGAKNDMKVSDENALKGTVTFPKINEQKAISNFITELDHLITLHQRKCEKLKELKKFMLQNMFV